MEQVRGVVMEQAQVMAEVEVEIRDHLQQVSEVPVSVQSVKQKQFMFKDNLAIRQNVLNVEQL
jgi:hypothetical protein